MNPILASIVSGLDIVGTGETESSDRFDFRISYPAEIETFSAPFTPNLSKAFVKARKRLDKNLSGKAEGKTERYGGPKLGAVREYEFSEGNTRAVVILSKRDSYAVKLILTVYLFPI